MAFNKNSQYIQSLVDYILDTKPYHSKLTDIVEEYHFTDSLNVKFTETTSLKTKIDPAWLYSYFSSSDPSFRKMPLKQLHSPLFHGYPSNANGLYPGAIKAFRDENTDLANLPYVYSKKAFQGTGIADVLVERDGNRDTTEPLLEGLDFFQSHGSFQLKIKQTIDANTNFVPSWTEVRDEDVISTASAFTQQQAIDVLNPVSAVNQIKALLLQIQALALSPAAALAMNDLLVIVNTPDLPQDYEPLLNQLVADLTPVLPGYTGWVGSDTPTDTYVSERFSQLTPSMYFNIFSDAEVRESGLALYSDVSTSFLSITSIATSPAGPAGDTWRVVAISSVIPEYAVFSALTGFIGSFIATIGGVTFSAGAITFVGTHISQPNLDDEIIIRNRNRLVFEETAPLETWDLIKVNPLAYTRPVLVSERFGFIEDLLGVNGLVTILDTAMPSGTVVLTCQADGVTFDLTSTSEPLYTGVAIADVPFNDARLAFTIRTGSAQPFQENDKFFIEIYNAPALPIDLDLGYGYDLDSYDNPDLNYDVPGKINFVFDTRFTDYNLDDLALSVDQTAVSGRKWRIQALPDLLLPIATLKKDGSGPSNSVDLQEATSGFPPDPALNAAPLYSMLGDTNPAVDDLKLYYASYFEVLYSDDNFNTVTSLGVVSVGGSFTDLIQGISFTLTPGTKPFVAVQSDDGLLNPIVEGGDVFSFEVYNAPAILAVQPVGLSSPVIPRLVMHGFDFVEAPAAQWTISFTSTVDYTVTGLQTEVNPGFPVPGAPATARLDTPGLVLREGNSFKDLGVHFTVVPGAVGLANGDEFTFTTFSRKPSYLVHGSASGWQPPAVVGETYWNGIIGFRLELPTAQLFDQAELLPRLTPTAPNTWTVGGGSLEVTRIRFDVPNLVYTLTPALTAATTAAPALVNGAKYVIETLGTTDFTLIGSPSNIVGTAFTATGPGAGTGVATNIPITAGAAGGWHVSRSDIGTIGFLARTGSLVDTYITIDTPVDVPAVDVVLLQLEITANGFGLSTAQDVLILHPTSDARLPTADDFVLVDKRTKDRLGLNLGYSSVDPVSVPVLSPLQAETIDVRFIDVFTGFSGVPIEATSPEAIIYQNWLPLTLTEQDSISSVAEFSDTAVRFDVSSSASGEAVGVLKAVGTNQLWPVQFEWDLAFYSKYLPLNASANIVTYGSGFNDIVNARITESVKFLINGGPLTTDFLFHDDINIQIDEANTWNIFESLNEGAAVVVGDAFAGFLPGYDNVPYDDEPFGFDTGIPLTDNFLEAQALSLIPFPTIVQQNRLNALLGLIDNFLEPGGISSTSLVEFLANVAADPVGATLASTGFGIPAQGMGLDISIGAAGANVNNPATEGAASEIQDALVVLAIDTEYSLETYGLDEGGLDFMGDRTAIIYSGSLPPVPAPLPGFTTYDEFETPLAVVGDPALPTDYTSRVFEFNFRVTALNLATVLAMPTPKVFIWLPAEPAPVQVPVVEKIGTGKYRVSVPSATEAKLYLEPGP